MHKMNIKFCFFSKTLSRYTFVKLINTESMSFYVFMQQQSAQGLRHLA